MKLGVLSSVSSNIAKQEELHPLSFLPLPTNSSATPPTPRLVLDPDSLDSDASNLVNAERKELGNPKGISMEELEFQKLFGLFWVRRWIKSPMVSVEKHQSPSLKYGGPSVAHIPPGEPDFQSSLCQLCLGDHTFQRGALPQEKESCSWEAQSGCEGLMSELLAVSDTCQSALLQVSVRNPSTWLGGSSLVWLSFVNSRVNPPEFATNPIAYYIVTLGK
ncbi:hypothetical protein J0S82_010590 [Galemys pyrenaicus]|uniref:Uncharacterized protein n=1 Tax=Galemys pyrenaicus TaxID=202257 RepID=A0A8J6DKD9_GALPY|nr:hypothetical protein J0S82_010590 [Galemys pyrenaicus]